MSLAARDRRALLEMFLVSAEERLDRMEEGLRAGAPLPSEDLLRHAHSLVGSAAVVGLDSIVVEARALEQALVGGDSEGAEEHVAVLRRDIDVMRTRRCVLAIEDDPASRLLLERVSAQDPRVALTVAHDGETGVRLARELLPDLILLDFRLPDIDGDVVLERLRAEEATRAIPVVVLSADATPTRVSEVTAAGAAAYLTKPIDLERLLELMRDGPA